MKQTIWLLIEVEDIEDVGKNEKQRYILQNVSFLPTSNPLSITTISAYCLKVHPAIEETKE